MTLEKIHPDPSGHFLITESGQPFFWLADTGWELFHRLKRDEVDHYLEIRRRQGFTVIQAVILAELDGLHTPNANGHVPLLGDDPTRPNEFYFRYVDEIIRLAADKGLYIGLLPTWGDKVDGLSWWGVGPVIFNQDNARTYGQFLGERYQNDHNILWILGGDRPAEGYQEIWAAMAAGICEGLGYRPFFTFHPRGGLSSSATLHESDWLDMNMWQSGHVVYDTPNWQMILSDYQRKPAKPVIDAEPNYEDMPVDPFFRKWQPSFGRFTDYDVRKQAYRAVFAGACGHTYGHNSVWRFWTPQRETENYPMTTWDEGILRPGASQLVYLKNLMLSRSYFSRIPAQEIIEGLPNIPNNQLYKDLPHSQIDSGTTLENYYEYFDQNRASYPVATCCVNRSYALIYFPLSEQTQKIDLSIFPEKVSASWFDPRSGKYHYLGEYLNKKTLFTSPISGPDWVLVLENKKEVA